MTGVATIARALGGRRSGGGWSCLCPVHNDHDPSLRITERDGKVLIKCWSGCEQDAVIDELRRRGLWSGRPRNGSTYSAAGARAASSIAPRDPMKTWASGVPFTRGCIVDRYLKTRGISVTDDEARSLRFSPALWHWPSATRWPAMLARVALAPNGGKDGASLTTHQTFLGACGSGKAPLGGQARLFPAGGNPAGGGVWFGDANPDFEFIIGEGIESTLSAMRIFGATAGCAALSALGIRRLVLPAEARKVRIFADNDELGQGLAAAREGGQRWRAESRAVAASIADAVGMDANDVWLRRAT